MRSISQLGSLSLDLNGAAIGKDANLWYAFVLASVRLLRTGNSPITAKTDRFGLAGESLDGSRRRDIFQTGAIRLQRTPKGTIAVFPKAESSDGNPLRE